MSLALLLATLLSFAAVLAIGPKHLILAADRTFQMWRYEVGMHRLLLRSTKTDRQETRMDVLFQNVQFIQGARRSPRSRAPPYAA